MPLILQLEPVCPQARVRWSSSHAPATNREFCWLCDPASSLSVLRTAPGDTGGPGLRALSFQLFHATGLGAFSLELPKPLIAFPAISMLPVRGLPPALPCAFPTDAGKEENPKPPTCLVLTGDPSPSPQPPTSIPCVVLQVSLPAPTV